MGKRFIKSFIITLIFIGSSTLTAQQISLLKVKNMNMVYLGKRYSYLLPHVSKSYENAMAFNRKLWNYKDSTVNIFLNDFQDMGHGGASAMPFNTVELGVEPYSFAFSIVPSNGRFQWLFNHELTHIVMADKPNKGDEFFRKLFLGKVLRNEESPLSALWSYITVPRWYSPRWYHEGIACFMETWLSGGMGRAMGEYDEMYFRSIVKEKEPIYSLIGLETEGTTIDFQVGANAYLYGSRFVSYLAYQYGIDKLKSFYTRTDSSRAFFANQFKKVYNLPIKVVWSDWIKWENTNQNQNLDAIKEYPLTQFRQLTERPLGNVSKVCYNPSTQKLYAAINYPGVISQIAEIDLRSGSLRKIATLDSPVLYYTTDITYNPVGEKIYITEQNQKYRNLVEVDVKTGKKRVVNAFTRTGNLVFNAKDNSIWGVRHDNGNAILVKIPEPYTQVIPMYTAPFGKVIFDLDISKDCGKLCASMSGLKGEQSVVMFDMDLLEKGTPKLNIIYTLEDNTLTQFKFSNDDKYLIGTSYYTGVSNVWRIKLDDQKFELLSNTETGYFMPVQLNADSLFVLQFNRNGMVPGTMPINVIEDANAISYLGSMVQQKHKVVEDWSLPPAGDIMGLYETKQEEKYIPVKQMKLANAYPDIAGFKKTVAVGYRVNWQDQMGLSRINLFLAVSPWSTYKDNQKVHAMVDWNLWNWHFSASYNKTDFYDLFGPTMNSRAGYSLGVNYRRASSRRSPLKSFYSFGVYTYGGLEVLPQYQNVASPIRNLQSATASYGISKLRKTLGAVMDESGYSWDVTGTTYYAGGSLYPSFVSNQDFGFLVPGIRNTSFWIRNSIGQSLGSRQSGLSYYYFGGFRNNYVDWQQSEQYRLPMAFAGSEIDEIQAYNYLKTMGELNMRPLRIKNVGTTWLYPTFIKSSLFGTHLMTDFDKPSNTSHIFNIGAQIDIQLVLFTYFKTTWSVGYAKKLEYGQKPTDKFMLSLKLLGN